MSTQTLHFSITGEYLTDIARACWVEGNPSKALDILNSAFPTMAETTKIDICMGRKKLVGTNSCTVQPDNATEHNGIPFRTIAEQVKAREAAVALREREVLARAEMLAEEVTHVSSPWGRLPVPNSMVHWRHGKVESTPHIATLPGETYEQATKRFEQLFPDVVEVTKNETARLMEQRRLDDTLRLMGVNPADARARLVEMAQPVDDAPPAPDKALFHLNGWIKPDGTFYGCGPMGHITLATRLGSTEGQAEKTWVKVQDADDPMAIVPRTTCFPSLPERGVTQRQYDTMFAWCEKHRRPFPNDLEIR